MNDFCVLIYYFVSEKQSFITPSVTLSQMLGQNPGEKYGMINCCSQKLIWSPQTSFLKDLAYLLTSNKAFEKIWFWRHRIVAFFFCIAAKWMSCMKTVSVSKVAWLGFLYSKISPQLPTPHPSPHPRPPIPIRVPQIIHSSTKQIFG